MFTIRIAIPDLDYPRMAELMSETQPEPVWVEDIYERDNRNQEGKILRRTVAVNTENQVIGCASAVHQAWDKEGHFYVWTTVDKDHRQQGIGAKLHEENEAFARQHGATRLNSEVRDTCEEGQQFAEKRGFHKRRHLFESMLRLQDFDERRFDGLIESVQGIHFFTLAESATETTRRQLHEINRLTAMSIPGYDYGFPSYEEMMDMWAKSSWFRPEGQLLAADGDKVIGLAAVGHFPKTGSMYNLMTGVHPDYQGRKIAQALKLLSILYAKNCDAVYIRTNNDSENAPMLAINRKFGYQPEPGIYFLAKDL